MKFNLLTLTLAASFALMSCEKCTDCTRDIYQGACDCGFGLTQVDTLYNLTPIENDQYAKSCGSVGDCQWFHEVTDVETIEKCGKTAEVEAQVIKLEAISWKCSSMD
jgi:hypothetical protein